MQKSNKRDWDRNFDFRKYRSRNKLVETNLGTFVDKKKKKEEENRSDDSLKQGKRVSLRIQAMRSCCGV